MIRPRLVRDHEDKVECSSHELVELMKIKDFHVRVHESYCLL